MSVYHRKDNSTRPGVRAPSDVTPELEPPDRRYRSSGRGKHGRSETTTAALYKGRELSLVMRKLEFRVSNQVHTNQSVL